MQYVSGITSAPQVAASLLYGIMLEPLHSAFGDFGSLITSELEKLPLQNPHDVLCSEFVRIFSGRLSDHD